MDNNNVTIYHRTIPEGTPAELAELVTKCFVEKPARDDLKALEQYLQETPELYKAAFDLAEMTQRLAISRFVEHEPGARKKDSGYEAGAKIALIANVTALKDDMGYERAPMIEKLLIENIVSTWLHLQWVEMQLTTKNNVPIQVVEFWEKRTSAAQRRHLRAIETLARVRKLSRNTPALQVNIARDGGQQAVINGDVNR